MTLTTGVIREIAEAPVPVLAISGTHATISGVRFSWSDSCPFCREPVYIYGDGGTVKAGIETSQSGKTARWYEKNRPGQLPALPEKCPHCLKGDAFRRGAFTQRPPLAVSRVTLPLLAQVWETLRAKYPVLAATADDANRRELAR